MLTLWRPVGRRYSYSTFACLKPGFTQGLGKASLLNVWFFFYWEEKCKIDEETNDSSFAHSAQNDQNAPRKWGNGREFLTYTIIKKEKKEVKENINKKNIYMYKSYFCLFSSWTTLWWFL